MTDQVRILPGHLHDGLREKSGWTAIPSSRLFALCRVPSAVSAGADLGNWDTDGSR
jgi:hypothetical protein